MSKIKYILECPENTEKLKCFLQNIFYAPFDKHYILKIEASYISLDDLLCILQHYRKKIEQFRGDKSLVLLTDDYAYDELPEFIPVAPTEEEASDIIEFEEIERDLGF